MKKRGFLLIFLLVLTISSFLLKTAVFAQEATVSGEIYTPRLLPDSPFYFLKSWKEKIELFLARSDKDKAQKEAEIATRRIAEAKQLIKKKKFQLAEKTMLKHREHLNKALDKLDRAQEQGEDVEVVVKIVVQATSQHLNVLSQVYEKVPQRAKEAIEKAIEVSSHGQERAIEAISQEKKEAIHQQIEENIKRHKQKIRKILEKHLEKINEATSDSDQCLCITLWDPVCGVDGKTYSNECRLGCAQVKKAHDGPCWQEKTITPQPQKLKQQIKNQIRQHLKQIQISP